MAGMFGWCSSAAVEQFMPYTLVWPQLKQSYLNVLLSRQGSVAASHALEACVSGSSTYLK